jgi:hypothetical protein
MSGSFIFRAEHEHNIQDKASHLEWIRRAVGAALPYVALIFVVAGEQKNELTRFVEVFFSQTTSPHRFLIGLVSGIAVLEIARLLMYFRSDVGEALAAFFFSILGAFVLFVLMRIGLTGLQIFLFGAIMAAGVDIILFGVPGGAQRKPQNG